MVAGGTYDDSTIFLDLQTLEWEEKAPLPKDIRHTSTLPYKNSVLAFGGYSYDGGYLDTIYYYNPDVDEWQLFSHMQNENGYFPLFYVPDSYANCT